MPLEINNDQISFDWTPEKKEAFVRTLLEAHRMVKDASEGKPFTFERLESYFDCAAKLTEGTFWESHKIEAFLEDLADRDWEDQTQ